MNMLPRDGIHMRKGVQGTASLRIYDTPIFFSIGEKKELFATGLEGIETCTCYDLSFSDFFLYQI